MSRPEWIRLRAGRICGSRLNNGSPAMQALGEWCDRTPREGEYVHPSYKQALIQAIAVLQGSVYMAGACRGMTKKEAIDYVRNWRPE